MTVQFAVEWVSRFRGIRTSEALLGMNAVRKVRMEQQADSLHLSVSMSDSK